MTQKVYSTTHIDQDCKELLERLQQRIQKRTYRSTPGMVAAVVPPKVEVIRAALKMLEADMDAEDIGLPEAAKKETT